LIIPPPSGIKSPDLLRMRVMNLGVAAGLVIVLTFLVIGADKAGIIHLRHAPVVAAPAADAGNKPKT
jgi:hypothetical protein